MALLTGEGAAGYGELELHAELSVRPDGSIHQLVVSFPDVPEDVVKIICSRCLKPRDKFCLLHHCS